MEQTLILVKGDGVKRRLIGEIIRRIEAKNLDVGAMKLMDVSRELAEEHYSEHRDKPFFEELVEFITTTPVVAMRVEGEGAIKVMRKPDGHHQPRRGRARHHTGRSCLEHAGQFSTRFRLSRERRKESSGSSSAPSPCSSYSPPSPPGV